MCLRYTGIIMRVLEPHHFHQKKSKRRRSPSKNSLIVLIAVIAVAGLALAAKISDSTRSGADNSQSSFQQTDQSDQPKQLRQFTAEEFKNSYSSYVYPNTQPITQAPEITGNDEADARIRKVAEARGYRLTAIPVSSIVKTGEPGLEGDDLIQPNAQLAWTQLKADAKKDKIPLKLTSAYRSIDYQRSLFLRRMQNNGVNVYTVLDGNADDELDAILARAAIPGYSRHHTGFTIDLSCAGIGLEAFRTTGCYKWLSKNNFEKAKTYGWVPSYPQGVGNSGPEPEPWEFVWIGTSRTYQ